MQNNFKDWTFYSLGDHALVFALEAKMDTSTLHKLKCFNAFLMAKKIKGIKDIIPAYHTLTLIYDITQFYSAQNVNDQLQHFAMGLLQAFENSNDPYHLESSKTISQFYKVPVCYENIYALDMENICQKMGLDRDTIIKMHTEKVYDVYSIGFLPGFTYMGMVNEKLKMERHSKPRNSVPAGSVGIAGLQTGIYPRLSPGGWQIIGRTPWKIFDPHPNKLAKFKVGDQVQFYAITTDAFNTLNEHI